MKVLKEEKQVFADGRIRKRTIDTSLGEKLAKDEQASAGVLRAIEEELRIPGELVTAMGEVASVDIIRVSQSYPGLLTVLNKNTWAVLIDSAGYKDSYAEHQIDKSTYFGWHSA